MTKLQPSPETVLRNVWNELRDALREADAPAWVNDIVSEVCHRHWSDTRRRMGLLVVGDER